MPALKKIEEVVVCTGVSWGHFTMTEGLAADLGTSSLGSCFAFIVLDAGRNQVFFAHVSNDSETSWLINHLLQPPTDFREQLNWNVRYFAFTGVEPGATTKKRVNLLHAHLRGKLVVENASTGAVVLKHAGWNSPAPKFWIVKNILPTNGGTYSGKSEIGMSRGDSQDPGVRPLLPMPESEFVHDGPTI